MPAGDTGFRTRMRASSEAEPRQVPRAAPAALRSHDRLEIARGALEIGVDYPVLVGAGAEHLAPGSLEPFTHGGVVVGAARAEPALQLLQRGRQDEHPHRLRMLRPD